MFLEQWHREEKERCKACDACILDCYHACYAPRQ